MSTTLNADMGEALGIHTFGNDTALLDLVDTISVACGMHSGDPTTMSRTVTAALNANVTIGAHPGLPDLVGFGRREMILTADEVRDLIRYQVGALTGFLDAVGAPLHHIKPHGALYGMLSRSEELMESACDVAEQYDVPILGLPNTAHQRVALRRGLAFISEYYVDLDYDDDGTVIVGRTGSHHDLAEVEAKSHRQGHNHLDPRHRTEHHGRIDMRALRPPARTRSRRTSPRSAQRTHRRHRLIAARPRSIV